MDSIVIGADCITVIGTSTIEVWRPPPLFKVIKCKQWKPGGKRWVIKRIPHDNARFPFEIK